MNIYSTIIIGMFRYIIIIIYEVPTILGIPAADQKDRSSGNENGLHSSGF